MAKIFTETDPPTLDYAAAVNALKGGREVATIHAAALLDIAVSLNRLTQLAELTESGGFDLDEDDADDGFEQTDDRPLEVGDYVALRSEVDDEPALYPVEALGSSEGVEYAVLPDLGKVWVSELVRVTGAGAEKTDDPDDDFEPPVKAKKSKKGKGDDA